MKITTLKWLICTALISFSLHVQAQEDLNDLLKESVDDSRKLIGSYISPFMKSVSLGLNQGWYNTAKPHKILGVDLTVTVSAMSIPDKEAFYDVSTLGLERVSLSNESPDYPNAPTVFGPDRSPIYEVNDSGETFEGPPGLGLKDEIGKNWMPVPMAHLGIGLPKNTDLKIRFIPTVDLGDDGSLKMFGVGVMHDIKQHIPGIKLLPFDLSAFVGYTKLSLDYRYEDESIGGDNQRSEFSISATTIQGVISKKFSVLTLYGGLGYNIAKSNLAVKGTYDINDDGDTTDPNETDPLDLKYAASGPRATAGFRLKLAVITLHADYTLQKYNSLTVGFGINVR